MSDETLVGLLLVAIVGNIALTILGNLGFSFLESLFMLLVGGLTLGTLTFHIWINQPSKRE